MADADHLEYRLRCHTKRTDLPADVLRDIGCAYYEIVGMAGLQKDLDEAKKKLSKYALEEMTRLDEELGLLQKDPPTSNKSEKLCLLIIACAREMVGSDLMDLEHRKAILDLIEVANKYRKERDCARREVCSEATRLKLSPEAAMQRANERSRCDPAPAKCFKDEHSLNYANERGWDCFKENTDD